MYQDNHEISEFLFSAGINRGDVLMIHGDAIAATQMNLKNSLEALYGQIIEYLGPTGTLVIPTFSYSFTNNENFDPSTTPSKLGVFSEYFRRRYSKFRSRNPVFSVSATGYYERDFRDSDYLDCFGASSPFGLMDQFNGKLMNLGCKFDLTYAHYVEQIFGVSYRYFKYFSGCIIHQGLSEHASIRYFVGKKDINYQLNFNKIREALIKDKKLLIRPFGRIATYTVSSADFKNCALDLLSKNEYSLIYEGVNA